MALAARLLLILCLLVKDNNLFKRNWGGCIILSTIAICAFHMYYIISNFSSPPINLELWNLLFHPNLSWRLYDERHGPCGSDSHVLHFMFG